MTANVSAFATRAGGSALRATLTGGITAGVLDAIFSVVAYVFVLRAFSIAGVLQYIASGLIGGPAAFSGGLLTAALGVGIHFTLALGFAGVYVAVARTSETVRNQPAVFGLLYGATIWFLMDLIVLPLTGTPKAPFDLGVFCAFLLDHMVLVGLPIALAARRYVR